MTVDMVTWCIGDLTVRVATRTVTPCIDDLKGQLK